MDIIYVPPSLVLGCNNPISFNVLLDFIEETTGHQLDLKQTGFSTGSNRIFDSASDGFVWDGKGSGHDYGNSLSFDLHGDGHGFGYGFYNLYGNGNGRGYGSYDGDGYGCGNIYGIHDGGGHGFGDN